MFAIFTRLARDEGAPRTESLPPERRLRTWLADTPSAVIWVPLVLGLVTLFVFLAMNGSAAHGCRTATGLHGAATARALSCQPVLESPGRS